MISYWDAWNKEHATRHGVSQDDARYVLRKVTPPYPEYIGGGKYRVRGQTQHGKYVQIIFVYRSGDQIKVEEMTVEELIELESSKGPYAYVIHARELKDDEKRRDRRRRR